MITIPIATTAWLAAKIRLSKLLDVSLYELAFGISAARSNRRIEYSPFERVTINKTTRASENCSHRVSSQGCDVVALVDADQRVSWPRSRR